MKIEHQKKRNEKGKRAMGTFFLVRHRILLSFPPLLLLPLEHCFFSWNSSSFAAASRPLKRKKEESLEAFSVRLIGWREKGFPLQIEKLDSFALSALPSVFPNQFKPFWLETKIWSTTPLQRFVLVYIFFSLSSQNAHISTVLFTLHIFFFFGGDKSHFYTLNYNLNYNWSTKLSKVQNSWLIPKL